eukprot:TRINITY_DN15128_c0_g1_i1.p1 TRINITY_DN15128_c0_g1~~TRINITY_DN15128_c0_g1_i1.p1  ORF type:complete len:111 (-),score=14.84 TRINITY_DN15128_c0_g1_i1:59-391(-)
MCIRDRFCFQFERKKMGACIHGDKNSVHNGTKVRTITRRNENQETAESENLSRSMLSNDNHDVKTSYKDFEARPHEIIFIKPSTKKVIPRLASPNASSIMAHRLANVRVL